ncbi:50S ribosomal protein L10 [Chloroflexota bacterium]
MAISKEKKVQLVEDYVERLTNSEALILTGYRGLTVASVSDLRRRLREVNAALQIVKNTLFERAVSEAGVPLPADVLDGPIAVGYCMDEVPPVAKVLVDFAKESATLEIHGAVLGAQFLDEQGVKSLAALPPREVLLAQLLGAVQGPASSLAGVVTAPMRELAQVLHARSEQSQEAAA